MNVDRLLGPHPSLVAGKRRIREGSSGSDVRTPLASQNTCVPTKSAAPFIKAVSITLSVRQKIANN